MLTDLSQCGIAPFKFAGLQFPKHVYTLPHGAFKARIERMRRPVCGDYYHAPRPLLNSPNPGTSFYLGSDFMPALRWQWCDEIKGAHIRHTGWYADEFGDGDKIRGIVMRLPHGRGFLAGWSMGESMASAIDGDIYPDEISAACAADSIAEHVAEREREYQAEQDAQDRAE